MDCDLTLRLKDAIKDAVDKALSKGPTAVAFSGGLDSGVIAAMLVDKGITAYTVGVEDAYDVVAAKELTAMMKMDWKHIPLSKKELQEDLMEMIKISGTVNPITLSFEVPMYYVLKYSKERTILSGQGADELFAGYAKYEDLEYNELRERMKEDMIELVGRTMEHERRVARHFGKVIAYPYMDRKVISIAEEIDIRDIAPKDVRKSVLRDVAILLGQPEIASKPKKAAQYGSGTMDLIRSIAKDRKMTINQLITAMSEGS